jgi:hypothetical protein
MNPRTVTIIVTFATAHGLETEVLLLNAVSIRSFKPAFVRALSHDVNAESAVIGEMKK